MLNTYALRLDAEPTEHPELAAGDLPGRLDEAEHLTDEARALLVGCKNALMEEGVREEALAIERWLESYRRGISAAQKISNAGPNLLDDIETRLRHALEEMHRYEEEGGNPASKSQQARVDEIDRAMCAIKKLRGSLRDASFVNTGVRKAAS